MPRDVVAGPRKSLADVMAELHVIWEAWAATVDHTSWAAGAAYGRESKDDSLQGFSPGAQLRAILDEATRRKIWIAWEHVYFDQLTGKTDQRVGFQALHADGLRRAWSAVIMFHSSRWARNALLSRRYKEELRKRGIQVMALNLPMDVSTPEGRYMERSIENNDEYQSDVTGHWVSHGLKEKVLNKRQPIGNLPECFVRQADGAILPHPELAPIVAEGAGMYLRNGLGERIGFGDLAKWARERGHRTPKGRFLTDEWWRNVLSNPTICGHLAYRRKAMRTQGGAELLKASFDGFISREDFDKLTQIRQARTRTAGRAPTAGLYVLTGALCGNCASQVTACGKGRLRCRSAAQHAGCDEPSVLSGPLEAEAGQWLIESIAMGSADQKRLVELVRVKVRGSADAKEADRLRDRLARLHDRYEMDKTMTKAMYQEQVRALEEAIRAAQGTDGVAECERAVALVRDFGKTYAAASAEQKQKIWQLCFDEVVIERGMLVAVRPKPDIAPLFAAACLTPRSRPDSNRRSRP